MSNSHPIYQIRSLSDISIAWPQLLDEIPIGIAILDPFRRVLYLNRSLEALTGFDSQEAYGLPCCYILRSNLCVQGCPSRQYTDESESFSADANIINRNRQKIPVRVTAAAIVDLKGELAGFMESVEDIRSTENPCAEADRSLFLGKLVGMSPEIQRILNILPAVAQTDSSILITGETGTGKDILAEAIHQASNRAKGPFVKVNCGALPETLLESELFGHQKGAFTGAVENKPGRFRLAHNGSLYLTEIGDLPLNLQVKLLSFLDDKVLHPLGSTKGVHVDVRVIAATHRNLEQMVREGRFREDLLFRLNVVRLHLPSLARRGDDVKMLMDHFLHIFNPRFKKKIKGFSSTTQRILLSYHYPGNVRELRNMVEYAVNVCEGSEIQPEHLPAYVLEAPAQPLEALGDGAGPTGHFRPAEHAGPVNVDWAQTEQKMILDAMLKARGRRSEAAKLLGWGRSTLWRKMKRYGMRP